MKNRFLGYSVPTQVFTVITALFFLALILEASAFLFALFLSLIGRNQSLFNEYRNKLHPVITGSLLKPLTANNLLKHTYWEEFDPWFGYRNNLNSKEGVFGTDKLGFISNGDTSRDISEKKEGTYRIFILGGSTVAGVGVNSPRVSISAYLERMLNSEQKHVNFEVINAGTIGWYSPQETAWAQFEIIHYKPDMIISFDGINDRRIADREAYTKKNTFPERYYWHFQQSRLKKESESSDLVVKFFRNALEHSKYNPARYFYSLHLPVYGFPILFENYTFRKKLSGRIKKLRRQYKKIPPSGWVRWKTVIKRIKTWKTRAYLNSLSASSNTVFANRFIHSLKNLYAICEANDIKYMAVLQPTLLPDYKVDLSGIEKFYYECKEQFFFYKCRANYRQSVLNYYDKCAVLGKKELGKNFVDFSKIFYGNNSRLYTDWVHYNSAGNKLIALKIKTLINSVLNEPLY